MPSRCALLPLVLLCAALLTGLDTASAVELSVLCPACKELHVLRTGMGDVRCKCGAGIDAAAMLKRKAEHLKRFAEVSASAVKQKGCLACHDGIAPISAKMSFIRDIGGKGRGCVICHEGDATANTMANAHKALMPNPGNMWVVAQFKGCGKCHSRNATVLPVTSYASDPLGQSHHVYRMERSLMSTTMGILNNTLCANGLLPIGVRKYANVALDDPLKSVPLSGTDTYKRWVAAAIDASAIQYLPRVERLITYPEAVKLWGEPKSMMIDYYRKECARCHVWTDGAKHRGDRRASGCTSCHCLYSNDAYYESDDPTIFKDEVDRPLRHEIVGRIPSVQCTRCHTRGKRIGTSFVGIMEFPYQSPWRKDATAQLKLHKKRYFHVGADLHFERGIECSDCHTSIDVHGDGNIYPTTDHAVEIECEDCHGTVTKHPWELPVGHGDAIQLGDQPRGTLRTGGKDYLLSARGNPIGNVFRDGSKATLIDAKGWSHKVPSLKRMGDLGVWQSRRAQVAMQATPHLSELECYSCHAAWAPQCYGCHLKEDFSGRTVGGAKTQRDWLASTHKHDRAGRTGDVKTPGKLVETRSYLRWERPPLGMNKEKRIAPVIPGCQVIATFVDKDGKVVRLNEPFTSSLGVAGVAMNPAQPHTIRRNARTCESCHADPKALGYGIDGGRFGVLSKAHEGDIPGAKRTEHQVPAIKFPHDLSTLVTRAGQQVQTMSYKSVRAMNDAERKLVEREGVCIGCHQHHGTARWAEVKKRLGPAKTAAQHAEVVSKAIEELMKRRK